MPTDPQIQDFFYGLKIGPLFAEIQPLLCRKYRTQLFFFYVNFKIKVFNLFFFFIPTVLVPKTGHTTLKEIHLVLYK